jgi:hypothetical protein
MAVYNEMRLKQTFMGRLSHGADLLEELTAVCLEQGICLGRVEAIGAVQKARIGYYDQDAREYNFVEINKHLEIIKLVGNISIREGEPMVHAHIALSDSKGDAFGGHLATGTIIFACEFIINSYDGPDYIRDHDEQTGLPLWKL